MRTTNSDWGERVPTVRFALDQDRLQSIGLTSSDVAQQMHFLLSGVPITEVRENIRSVQVAARSAGNARLDPSKIADFTLAGAAGQRIPLSQIGTVEIRMEDPIMRRRDRTPTITVRGDIAEGLQPPDVSTAVWKELQPIITQLPAGYRIEQGGSIEESGKANRALAPLFPIMIALTLITIIVQVRSISVMMMVFATAPLGLIGVIPTLLLFQQPFGINALVGLVALSGILMRNTLILIGQIRQNEKDGLAPFDAVVEATVQRSRPVILTALAAMLAFIPLTHSVFWGTLAYTGRDGRARRSRDSNGACPCLAEAISLPPPIERHSHADRKQGHYAKQDSARYRRLVRHRRSHGATPRDGGLQGLRHQQTRGASGPASFPDAAPRSDQ
jgi:multidrug efflux pump subunit AcrB